MDWNNDGKKDLITGENNGRIRIYINQNTDADPVFQGLPNGYVYLQDGAGIFDCGSYSIPHVVDWNEDGKKDVICGESSGRIYLLININTDADPQFGTKVLLQNGASVLDVGGVSSPTVADFDGDGNKDLLIGETYGNLFVFLNRGTNAAPSFNGNFKLSVDGAIYDCGYYSRPEVVDWDKDGTLDIISGIYDGKIQILKALGDLSADKTYVSERFGGTVDFTIDAGQSNGGRTYVIFGSVTGTEPGTTLPGGTVIPMNWDMFTNLMVNLINTPVFHQFQGTLSKSGTSTAQLNTGTKIGTGAGLVMSYAYVLYYPFEYPSNPVHVEILP